MQQYITVLKLELETLSKATKDEAKIASLAAIDIITSRIRTYASPVNYKKETLKNEKLDQKIDIVRKTRMGIRGRLVIDDHKHEVARNQMNAKNARIRQEKRRLAQAEQAYKNVDDLLSNNIDEDDRSIRSGLSTAGTSI